jgi:integrase
VDDNHSRHEYGRIEPDFRRLIEVALLTGARYGELRRMLVRDFDSQSKTALVAEPKSSKPRRLAVIVGEEFVED